MSLCIYTCDLINPTRDFCRNMSGWVFDWLRSKCQWLYHWGIWFPLALLLPITPMRESGSYQQLLHQWWSPPLCWSHAVDSWYCGCTYNSHVLTVREQFTAFFPPLLPFLHSLLFLEEQMIHFSENLLNVGGSTPLWLSDHTAHQG